MAKADSWMPLYIAAYRKDTARLSCEQHGAYLLLIMEYWVAGAPDDDDECLAQITRLELRQWRRVRPKLERFFTIANGVWRHKRVDEEYEKAQRLSAARRESGARGGRPPKAKSKQTESKPKPIGSANGNLEGSQTALQTETHLQGKNSALDEQRVLSPTGVPAVACLDGAPPLSPEAAAERAAIGNAMKELAEGLGASRRIEH